MLIKDLIKENTIHCEIGYLNFVWQGGAYIDILIRCDLGNVEYTDQCINVWDYSERKATIPFTTEALIKEAAGWINGSCE